MYRIAISRKAIYPWLFFAGLWSVFAAQAFAQDSSVSCAAKVLPSHVRALLQEKFPELKIAEVADLNNDDRELWLRQYPDECPGVLSGHFDSAKKQSYVILLIRRHQGRFRQTLVVVREDGKLKTVYRDAETVSPSVLVKLLPGTHLSSDRSEKIHTRLDAFLAEKLEAGAILYYWKAGRYRSMQYSE